MDQAPRLGSSCVYSSRPYIASIAPSIIASHLYVQHNRVQHVTFVVREIVPITSRECCVTIENRAATNLQQPVSPPSVFLSHRFELVLRDTSTNELCGLLARSIGNTCRITCNCMVVKLCNIIRFCAIYAADVLRILTLLFVQSRQMLSTQCRYSGDDNRW